MYRVVITSYHNGRRSFRINDSDHSSRKDAEKRKLAAKKTLIPTKGDRIVFRIVRITEKEIYAT